MDLNRFKILFPVTIFLIISFYGCSSANSRMDSNMDSTPVNSPVSSSSDIQALTHTSEDIITNSAIKESSTNSNVNEATKRIDKASYTVDEMDFSALLEKKNFRIKSKLQLDNVKLNKDTYLLDFQQSDVNGDNITDNILMSGVHQKNYTSIYYDNIRIIIQDGKSKRLTFISSEDAFGYSYSIYSGDFNGDKINDILFSVNNGMTGGAGQYTFSIYSFINDKVAILFDNQKISEEISFKVDFKDGYELRIYCPILGKSIDLDIRNKKKMYKDLDLYKGNKLISPIEGCADNYCELMPEDIDKDGILELKGTQYVSGYGHSDAIGMLHSVLKFDIKKGNWVLQDFNVEKIQ